MSALDEFTVADDTRQVYCCHLGMSWGYTCTDPACERMRAVGWDSDTDVASGALFHLQWHANGMPECTYCCTQLAVAAAKACPPGECPERDGYGSLEVTR